MDERLLSLKWNNHKRTFFNTISKYRSKSLYTDVILACDGEYFNVHKIVLSSCSEYFEEIFEKTQCKCPVIILKDIQALDLKYLLEYMYIGEVEVRQEQLTELIKAAECLKVKGLASPDDEENIEKPPSRKRKKDCHEENSSSKRAKSPIKSESQESTSQSTLISKPVENKFELPSVIVKEEPCPVIDIDDVIVSEPDVYKGSDILESKDETYEESELSDIIVPNEYELMHDQSISDTVPVDWGDNNSQGFSEASQSDQVPVKKEGIIHQCPFCPKKFKKKAHWREHYMVHTGEKPYACPYCLYRGIQKSAVKSHIQHKHKDIIFL